MRRINNKDVIGACVLHKVTLCIGSRSRPVSLERANLLGNCKLTAAVEGKHLVCTVSGTNRELGRCHCVGTRQLDGTVNLFLGVLRHQCQLVQRVLVGNGWEWVVRSVVSSLCQRDVTQQDNSHGCGRGRNKGNRATTSVSNARHTVMRRLGLHCFSASRIGTQDDRDVIVVQDFESIAKSYS